MKVTFLLGSSADDGFAKEIGKTLDEFGIPYEIIVASAHKVPEKVVDIVKKLNSDPQPHVIITVVGMSNGLGGVVAGSSVHPVINCPPYASIDEYMADIHSNLRMPSDVPVMTILNAKNAGIAAAKIFGEFDENIRKKVEERIAKVKSKY